MGQKPRVSNKSNTWVWWMSIDVDSSTTLSLKQNSYWQTACNGRKMPKKFLIYVFFKPLWAPHVVQLSVNFWYLGLLVLGANLVLGSMLVGNHWSKVAPKLENSLLIFFSLALASQPFGHRTSRSGRNWWNQCFHSTGTAFLSTNHIYALLSHFSLPKIVIFTFLSSNVRSQFAFTTLSSSPEFQD